MFALEIYGRNKAAALFIRLDVSVAQISLVARDSERLRVCDMNVPK
jgi:hypothetical protein